jgi:hypothetical protein
MRLALWILQVLLALHTLTGAAWKFTTPVSTMPSLSALPQAAWVGLGVVELPCALLLLLPAIYAPAARAVPWAAGWIVLEMLLYAGLHLSSGSSEHGQIGYWLAVAGLAGGLAWKRSQPA